MGSFQQITMGIICLAAAFWVGSALQDQPAGQHVTAPQLPDGTIDPNQSTAPANLVASTKGFLSSLFESPADKKPVTVADLRQRSQATRSSQQPSARVTPPTFPVADSNSPLLRETSAENSIPRPATNSSADTGPFSSDSPAAQNSNRVAIVPDFSSLAEEVNRGLSFNDRPADSATQTPNAEQLLPVPAFSSIEMSKNAPVLETDWETVRQQVADAEKRLKSHRDQATQPIPAIQESVTRQTREFQNRQQTPPRQHAARTPADRPKATVRRPQPSESWAQKKERWDVFPDRRRSQTTARQSGDRPASAEFDTQFNQGQFNQGQFNQGQSNQGQFQQAQRPSPLRQARESDRSRRSIAPAKIVEVDRDFNSPRYRISQRTSDARPSSTGRIRSLNDDREEFAASVATGDPRLASRSPTVPAKTPTRTQNQLRPKYDPNPGSSPEFVSPPDYNQFRPANSDQSSPPQTTSRSEMVDEANVTYGSFQEYVTQPGDTLQTISTKFYGSADYYFDLYLANRALLRSPASVPQGRTLKIPRFDSK